MTDDIIKRLREAIAAGPTPGPWFHAYDFGQIGSVENAAGHVILQAQQTAPGREDVDRRNKTAAYIAAASPDNIAALLDRLDKAERERERLRAELDTERMRLAACGVVAMADTPESAAEARNMHPDYRSASCDDVARRVDECIRLRAQVETLEWQLTMESIDTTCHCAAKSAADCGCPGAVWPEDTLRSENGRLREALHTAREGLAHIKAVARLHAEGADTALEGRS